MTKPKHEYSEEQFSDSFFEYDVSKLRTETAVPLQEQGLMWHFAKYEKHEFSIVDELDSIFRYVGEIDSDLADAFAADVKDNLDDLFDEIHDRLHALVTRYATLYARDEDYVFDRWLAVRDRRKRSAA